MHRYIDQEVIHHNNSSSLSIAEIREAFRVLDRDGNGFISKQELGMAMRSLGYMPSEVELAIIMQRLDMDGEYSQSSLLPAQGGFPSALQPMCGAQRAHGHQGTSWVNGWVRCCHSLQQVKMSTSHPPPVHTPASQATLDPP